MSEPGPQAAGRIVVGIDGSRSSMAALDWAAEQAVLTGSVLEVVTTWELPATIGWTMPPYDPAADAQRALDAIIEKVHGDLPALEIRSSVLEGHPAAELVEASQGADLLVVGCRGHGEFAGMLLGSVSQHCTTNAHCPVVVIRGQR
jgi:nucleotide-binding universal stress UspA family protein